MSRARTAPAMAGGSAPAAEPKPMGIRARRAARVREAILNAALKVFSRKGFEASTMDDIAVQLDATKGLVYYYFKTKDEVLRAIIAHNPIVTEVEEVLGEIARLPAREALSTAFSSVRALLTANKDLVRLLHVQSHLSTTEAELVFRNLRERLYNAAAVPITARIREGEIRGELGARNLAKFLVDFITFDFISESEVIDPEGGDGYRRQVLEVLLHGVLTPISAGVDRRAASSRRRKATNPA